MKTSGTVIVEVTVNDDGTMSNAVVIQSVGYGCDEEALLAVKRMMDKRNKCILRYRWSGETKRTLKFPFTFKAPED